MLTAGIHDSPGKKILIGCGHHAILGMAEKVIEAVKGGKIRRFFVIGGCDGAKPGRNYYTRFAEQLPSDTVILTLACGKYRFNRQDLGEIDGIPRLLDVGQCNDTFSGGASGDRPGQSVQLRSERSAIVGHPLLV